MKKLTERTGKAAAMLLAAVALFASMSFGSAMPVSAATTKTQSQAVQWALGQIGKAVAESGYGSQCVQLVKQFYRELGVNPSSGHAKEYWTNALPAGWVRIANTPEFIAQPGDIAVWGSGRGKGYGHVAIVISATVNSLDVVAQNTNGAPYGAPGDGRYASRDKETYTNLLGIIRPNFTSAALPPQPAPNAANWTDAEKSLIAQIYDYELYKGQYADLRAAFGDNKQAYFDHLLRSGIAERRTFSRVYQNNHYLAANPDIMKAFGDSPVEVLKHYLNHGLAEGRKASPWFDVSVYANNYADLRNAYASDWKMYPIHYTAYGYREQRNATTNIVSTPTGATPTLYMSSHVAMTGDLPVSADGRTGTTGQGLALEKLVAYTDNPNLTINISTYTEAGWSPFTERESGSAGMGRAIRAVRFTLGGPLAQYYNVTYRSHNSIIGWGSWANDGAIAGNDVYQAEMVELRISRR